MFAIVFRLAEHFPLKYKKYLFNTKQITDPNVTYYNFRINKTLNNTNLKFKSS